MVSTVSKYASKGFSIMAESDRVWEHHAYRGGVAIMVFHMVGGALMAVS